MRILFLCLVFVLTVPLAGCDTLFGLQGIGPLLQAVGQDPAKAQAKVESVTNDVLNTVVEPIGIYCKAPSVARAMLRAKINDQPNMAGAKIGIACPGETLTLDATVAPAADPEPPPAPTG